jgi:uncharacterized protein YcfJ
MRRSVESGCFVGKAVREGYGRTTIADVGMCLGNCFCNDVLRRNFSCRSEVDMVRRCESCGKVHSKMTLITRWIGCCEH